jgi:hypothetical protein
MVSSTCEVGGWSVSFDDDAGLDGLRKATHGRTPNSVFARLVGSSQRCSTLKPGGSLAFVIGRPISSRASRRAVSKGFSSRVSAFPTCLISL